MELNQVVTRRGGSFSSSIGVLAAIALVVGFFMPWTSTASVVESQLGVTQARLRQAEPVTGTEESRTRSAIERLKTGEAISGADWANVLDRVEEHGGLDEAGQRRLAVARVGVVMLPFAAGALALLLLLMSVPPGTVMRVGIAPIAAVLKLAQANLLRGLVLVVTMAVSAVVFVIADLLWLGVSVIDDEPGKAGLGIQLMVGGSAVAFLSSFFGYGPGRLRSLIWVVILLILLVVGIVVALNR